MLRGDVHRFYEQLRRRRETPPSGPLPELNHVRAIVEYYRRLAPEERILMLAWARKEESGIGIIPLTLSGVPLIGLIFAPMFQEHLEQMPDAIWILLYILASLAVVAGFWVHQRQRAYTALHLAILDQLCTKPKEPGKRPGPFGG